MFFLFIQQQQKKIIISLEIIAHLIGMKRELQHVIISI